MHTLYRTRELRDLEARGRAGLPDGTLMQRAGAAAARVIDGFWRRRLGDLPYGTTGGQPAAGRARVLVLCGAGDNGGDGFACAWELQQRGYHCICWAPMASGSADAQAARQRWLGVGGVILSQLPGQQAFDFVVDALLGIGASRPLDGALLAALQWTSQGSRPLPVIALDLPSGLDADTGEWIGGVAGAPAVLTVTFLGDKPGLHLRSGLEATGSLHVETLGLDAAADAPAAPGRLNGPAQFPQLRARRSADVNKGSYGTVAVCGGAAGMVGATLLAGRAALRMGAGKVFVNCIGAPDLQVDPLQPELMIHPGRAPAAGEVLVAGCGMGSGPAAREYLAQWLVHEGPAIYDADALNLLAGAADLRAVLRSRGHATVLTPHPGEAGRLLHISTTAVQLDRVAAAVRLAEETQAIVVLKGAGTVIADRSGRYAINPTGGPALASAGTGDVLAGITGALLAQYAASVSDVYGAVCAAVWLHGRAAQLYGGDVGLVASEVAPLAVRAWQELRAV